VVDWSPWVVDLKTALEEGDDAELSRWAASFTSAVEDTDELVATEEAKKILDLLQQYARFPLLRSTGHTVSRRNRERTLRMKLAQGRIEMGEATQAIGDLLDLVAEIDERMDVGEDLPPGEPLAEERAEALGLLGRAYKKLYIDASPTPREPRSEDYQRAYDYYASAYEQCCHYWHGINLIALRAFQLGIQGRQYTDDEELRRQAEEVLCDVGEEDVEPWGLATRAEALLATGQNSAAMAALQLYLEHPETTAFMVQSTRRQMIELWGLNRDSPPGNQILPMLDASFAHKGGPIHIETALTGESQLEALLGDTEFYPLQFLRDALKRSRAVARVGRRPERVKDPQSTGTGFLLDGNVIAPQLAELTFLLTNAHVVTSDDDVRRKYPEIDALKVDETNVAFLEARDQASRPISVVREWFTSPPWEFDATLLELESRPGGVSPAPVAADRVVPRDRVNILGHPYGDEQVVSMQDNRVISVEPPKLTYRTPTEHGSSGSPVFNQQWEVVALHHAGPAFSNSDGNEGVLIGDIIAAMAQSINGRTLTSS
jgi:V8-like Glu-specific endopeptidase